MLCSHVARGKVNLLASAVISAGYVRGKVRGDVMVVVMYIGYESFLNHTYIFGFNETSYLRYLL